MHTIRDVGAGDGVSGPRNYKSVYNPYTPEGALKGAPNLARGHVSIRSQHEMLEAATRIKTLPVVSDAFQRYQAGVQHLTARPVGCLDGMHDVPFPVDRRTDILSLAGACVDALLTVGWVLIDIEVTSVISSDLYWVYETNRPCAITVTKDEVELKGNVYTAVVNKEQYPRAARSDFADNVRFFVWRTMSATGTPTPPLMSALQLGETIISLQSQLGQMAIRQPQNIVVLTHPLGGFMSELSRKQTRDEDEAEAMHRGNIHQVARGGAAAAGAAADGLNGNSREREREQRINLIQDVSQGGQDGVRITIVESAETNIPPEDITDDKVKRIIIPRPSGSSYGTTFLHAPAANVIRSNPPDITMQLADSINKISDDLRRALSLTSDPHDDDQNPAISNLREFINGIMAVCFPITMNEIAYIPHFSGVMHTHRQWARAVYRSDDLPRKRQVESGAYSPPPKMRRYNDE